MSATVPLLLLLILVHVGVFLTSSQADRLQRLLMACLVMLLAIPALWVAMTVPGVDGLLQGVLKSAPLILAVLAFLVYLRPRRS